MLPKAYKRVELTHLVTDTQGSTLYSFQNHLQMSSSFLETNQRKTEMTYDL